MSDIKYGFEDCPFNQPEAEFKYSEYDPADTGKYPIEVKIKA
jgi:hypothetical protein